MRKLALLAAILLGFPALGASGEDCACFTPTAEQISEIESRITDLPAPVYGYARYYAGRFLAPVTFRGQTVIPRRVDAQFRPPGAGDDPGIHIVAGGRLPPLRSEGCISYLDDPPSNDAFEIYARCNRPGGWTPSPAEIAGLETRLTVPVGTRPLDRYARHYAGVTESGVRLIRGVLVSAADGRAGITVETEIELPLVGDDGCGVITAQYNPDTQLGSIHCGKPDWLP